MRNKIYRIIILGPQGSGKGTQAEFLSEKLGAPTISAGQVLRSEIEKGSRVGKESEVYMNKGELVPHHIVNKLIRKRISEEDCKNGFIIDGFPRARIQARFLERVAKITNVLEVWISDEEAIRRLKGRRTCSKCGKIFHLEYDPPKKQGICDDCKGKLEIREDDTEKAIRQRLKIYHDETEEVIEYYKDKRLLIKINGEQSIEDVKKEIFEKLRLK